MAPEDRNSSDFDADPNLSELFQQAFGAIPPRDEFVESLRERLAAELQSAAPASRNGRAAGANHLDVQRQAVSYTDLTSASPTVPTRERRQTGRSLMAALTAAAIVIAASVWSSRPSYSWTSVVQAMEAQPWVASTAEAESGRQIHNWFSSVNRVVIRQADGNIVWDDLQEQVRFQYRAESEELWQSSLAGGSTSSVEQALVSFLLNQTGRSPDAFGDAPPGPIVVRHESWRKFPGEGAIELDVVLAWGAGSEESVHFVLQLDPETHLPELCRVVESKDQDAHTIRFEYPTSGPQEVYDLGIPADVVIRRIDESAAPMRVASAPVESERSHIDVPVQPIQIKTQVIEVEKPQQQTVETVAEREQVEIAQAPALQQLAPPPTVSLSTLEMTQRVDELMQRLWERNGISPVAGCSDLEFLRRVYLDLTGRVPTVSEVREFMRDTSAGRRERLVEQLLTRRDYATHLAAVWRRFLLPEGIDLSQYGGAASFEQWLTDHFRENTPYDRVVRELLLAEGRLSESGPILFYTALKLEPERLASQTSRAFLGIRLECAQCHDHFFDNRWKQKDFWGYAAFFARISRPQGKMEMVSPVLQVKDSNRGDVTLPDDDEIIPPRYPLGATLTELDPSSSRRQELADWMTAPDNPHFSRATVNRVWAHLFGRGIVEPVDDMRSDNPPIAPEVLDELAGYFVASGFDLRDLFRVIVLSKTYQLSSSAPDDEPSRALHFAQMNIKSFTAEQLYDSIAVATRLEAPTAEDGSLMRSANVSRQSFLEQFRAPPGHTTDYQSGIPQALTLMNGGLIQGATGLKSSGILRSLEAPFFSDEQRVETLFLATLSRPPDDVERQTMLEYLTAPGTDRNERLSDILWALLNTAEFTLNH